ncbi:MAG TPA: TIGR03435 family protein, partial [Bryocella sp.]|nr:TIGR03435 family protein [Bryocella sp.]
APATTAPTLHFDVASIRPTDPKTQGWRLEFTVDGLVAQKVTLRMLIKEAYAAYEDGRIVGGPSWLDTDHFDILARLDPAEVPTYKDLTLAQRREMLRALLADRFQLTVHPEQRSFPAFALRIAKGGPKLQRANDTEIINEDGVKGYHSLVTRSRRGVLEGKNFSMPELARILEHAAGRIIVDETDLTDRYDFLLQWTPTDASGNPIETSNGTADSSEKSYPFFFQALEQELGLKLEPTKTAVGVYVIDHAQPPSSN